jgi:transposase
MDKKTIGDWIMYYEIQRLMLEGLKRSAIGKLLGIDARTVKRYASMNEVQHASFLDKKEIRTKVLSAYESFVKDRLSAYPSTSAAQLHDWLKEHHPDFPKTSPKTVYNFVMAIRQKYDIPVEADSREFFVVEQLPYGFQGQADFGQYTLRSTDQRRKKVHFFVMMLSRSRMKFVRFSDSPFTTGTAIDAHEEAFAFFKGIPVEVVYDQDRLFLIDERLGELLLTQRFKDYVFEQEFRVHFCRKADPQSKGKVENVIKYIKNNFLYGRSYFDINTLQLQVLGWLERTGNGMAHSSTRKVPLNEWVIEQLHLAPWVTVRILPSYILRTLRIDNTFSYNGNFYTVPQGTYKRPESTVMIRLNDDALHVYDDKEKFLCRHLVQQETRGNTIINTDHKRDKSLKVFELLAVTAAMFENPALAMQYFEMIRQDKKRYLRDQVQAIKEAIQGRDKRLTHEVLQRCVQERYVGASIFRELLALHQDKNKDYTTPVGKIILLDPNSTRKAETQPDKSDLDDYELAFSKN